MRFSVGCCSNFIVYRRCCSSDDQIWLILMEYQDKDEDDIWCVAISTVASTWFVYSIKKWHSTLYGELDWIIVEDKTVPRIGTLPLTAICNA